jgi:hypothetical protein
VKDLRLRHGEGHRYERHPRHGEVLRMSHPIALIQDLTDAGCRLHGWAGSGARLLLG